ncbi:MAG TPA: hypothetical protein VME70_16960 [Mycobacteriales bacterium]|nr:hypothetical protein [Mycobacteriales bacterium]
MSAAARTTRLAAAVLVPALALSGCAAVKAVKTIHGDIEHNKATVSSFTQQLQSSPAKPFRATYVTTGSSPATITYAVQPPNGLVFTDTPSGARSMTEYLVDARGVFECTVAVKRSRARPTCQKLGSIKEKAEQQLFDIYTPAHWVGFLRDFSLAAGFAGDHVTSSTKTVNGFSMNCVDFVAGGVPGRSTICSTSQGLLGYVKVASDNAKFEITGYSATPPRALFAVPPHAKITK